MVDSSERECLSCLPLLRGGFMVWDEWSLEVFKRSKGLGNIVVLINDVDHSAVIDFGCVSSRTMD